jgi:hypothetical protein
VKRLEEQANPAKGRGPLCVRLLKPGDPEPEESDENVMYLRLNVAGAQPGGGKPVTDVPR